MNRCWEQPLQAAESGFNFLPIDLLDVFDVGLGQGVFGKVFIVRLIAIEDRSFWEIKFEGAQMRRVAVAAGRKRNFDPTSFFVRSPVQLFGRTS